jgi:plastocyanin
MKYKSLFVAALSIIIVAVLFACGKSDDGYTSNNSNNNGGNNNGGSGAITITGMSFPASVTVKKGTAVTVKNNDNMAHTATADNGSFDSGNIPAGGTGSFTPAVAGTFNYHCTYHPAMTGKLVVTE